MDLAEVVTGLNRKRELRQKQCIPTGSLGLDLALGGGYRFGRIAELSGDYSSYKTILALHTVAQAQKFGPVMWLDSAMEFRPDVATRAGVDTSKLILAYPRTADHALVIMREAGMNDFAMVVLDWASGMDQDDEYELLDRSFSWLKADLHGRTVALFLNDLTLRSDAYFSQAVRAWASQQVVLHPGGPGYVKAVVTRNSFAPHPQHTIDMRFLSDAIFDAEYELVKLGLECGVFHRKGSWIYYQGLQIGQGVEDAVQGLRNDILTVHLRECIQTALA